MIELYYDCLSLLATEDNLKLVLIGTTSVNLECILLSRQGGAVISVRFDDRAVCSTGPLALLSLGQSNGTS